MPKSVKEVLVEQSKYDSFKNLYQVVESVKSASSALDAFTETNTNEAVKGDLKLLKVGLSSVHSCAKAVIQKGLSEAKTFEDDSPITHFSHGMITCYIDPANNRFVLTKDSRNGLNNYDTIVSMTKNDIKNIIKCCQDMLADVKAKSVPDEEPKEE